MTVDKQTSLKSYLKVLQSNYTIAHKTLKQLSEATDLKVFLTSQQTNFQTNFLRQTSSSRLTVTT